MPISAIATSLTPVQQVGDVYVKRDDLYSAAGVCGGKVRTCLAISQGATGLVTSGSRASPQVNIVAHIARYLGIPCRLHIPTGELSPEIELAILAGGEVVQHSPGYNSVICSRAKADAVATGWREIPFGMECREAVLHTASQISNIPETTKRIVIPVGSGMSLAGIVCGLQKAQRNIPILGIQVGADPTVRLDHYAPGWRDMVSLVKSEYDYHSPAPNYYGKLLTDPIYEAKCLQSLQPGDMLWCVGIRQGLDVTIRAAANQADTKTHINIITPHYKIGIIDMLPIGAYLSSVNNGNLFFAYTTTETMPVGTLLVSFKKSSNTLKICQIARRVGYRGSVGSALFNHALLYAAKAGAKAIELEVVPDNTHGIAFYTSRGMLCAEVLANGNRRYILPISDTARSYYGQRPGVAPPIRRLRD